MNVGIAISILIKIPSKGSLTYRICPRETSYVRLGVGFAAVTFLCKTSWKNSIVFSKTLTFRNHLCSI
jgi:hypothetical protein